MTKKKTYNSSSKVSSVEEPVAAYSEQRIVFPKSLQEENELTYKQRASIPYLENLINVTAMLSKLYASELKENPTFGTRIYFDNK